MHKRQGIDSSISLFSAMQLPCITSSTRKRILYLAASSYSFGDNEPILSREGILLTFDN